MPSERELFILMKNLQVDRDACNAIAALNFFGQLQNAGSTLIVVWRAKISILCNIQRGNVIPPLQFPIEPIRLLFFHLPLSWMHAVRRRSAAP